MSLLPLGILSSSGAGGAAAFELISSQILSSATSSVTFSSLPSGFQHLQLRVVGRSAAGQQVDTGLARFNGDSGSNYSWHRFQGDGYSLTTGNASSTTYLDGGFFTATNGVSVYGFGAEIIDILDYANTSKNKTIRSLSGNPDRQTSQTVGLKSGNWNSTAAITSITYSLASAANWTVGSRFSLYGVKG